MYYIYCSIEQLSSGMPTRYQSKITQESVLIWCTTIPRTTSNLRGWGGSKPCPKYFKFTTCWGSRARKESDSTHLSWSLPFRQEARGQEGSSMTKYCIDRRKNTVHSNEELCVNLHETNKLEGETAILKTVMNSILKSIMEYHLLYFFFKCQLLDQWTNFNKHLFHFEFQIFCIAIHKVLCECINHKTFTELNTD